jgi:hypothetical protein
LIKEPSVRDTLEILCYPYPKEGDIMTEQLAKLSDGEPLIPHPLVEKYKEFVKALLAKK